MFETLNGGFVMLVTPEILDQILKDYEKPEDFFNENGRNNAENSQR
jgi:hypothetical protein